MENCFRMVWCTPLLQICIFKTINKFSILKIMIQIQQTLSKIVFSKPKNNKM